MSSIHLGSGSNRNAGGKNGLYSRPMTSLAVLAPNNPNGSNNRAPLVAPASRTFDLSSTTLSSNSLPSPEMLINAKGANPVEYFNYSFANKQHQQPQQQQSYLKSLYMPQSPSINDHTVNLGGQGSKSSPSSSIDRQTAQTSPGYLTKPGTASGGNPIYGTIGSLRASMSNATGPTQSIRHNGNSTVRTKYVCIGSNPSELSFEPNQVITNGKLSILYSLCSNSFDFLVHQSSEPGWLEGTLNGKTGLVPYNYVEFLDVGN